MPWRVEAEVLFAEPIQVISRSFTIVLPIRVTLSEPQPVSLPVPKIRTVAINTCDVTKMPLIICTSVDEVCVVGVQEKIWSIYW